MQQLQHGHERERQLSSMATRKVGSGGSDARSAWDKESGHIRMGPLESYCQITAVLVLLSTLNENLHETVIKVHTSLFFPGRKASISKLTCSLGSLFYLSFNLHCFFCSQISLLQYNHLWLFIFLVTLFIIIFRYWELLLLQETQKVI